MRNPLITIITPTYNQGVFIKDCLDSVKNQTYKNIEHLVFDAQSTDQTHEVVKSYLDVYNLTFISESDTGQADAINKGLDKAMGDIVCWLNSDDFFFDDGVLARVAALFQANPALDVVTGDGYHVDEKKGLLNPILTLPEFLTDTHFRTADYLLQPSTFWRRNPVRLDTSLHYAFDWKYFAEFFQRGYRYFYARDYYSCYRIHGSSKTYLDNARRKAEIVKVLRDNRASAPCVAWAKIVAAMYGLSEMTGSAYIKNFARFANRAVRWLSNGRIQSC